MTTDSPHTSPDVRPEDMFTAAYWDARYAGSDQVWSGNPNPHLVAHAGDPVPGTALDVGCGEGADTIWLAAQGWRVTAVDVSEVALARAAARAADAGPDVAARITWLPVDLRTWTPDPRRFDLVSAQFMHLPRPWLQRAQRALAAAVAPGGRLLVVGHHPADPQQLAHAHDRPDMLFTAEQVAAELDPEEWSTITPTAPRSDARTDAVLHATRRPS